MARTQTLVQLTDDLLAELDAEASRRGLSRSALIREAVAVFLAEGREARLVQDIVEGYRRVPQATPDEWGALDAQGASSTLETLRRLDLEEQAAGFDRW